MRIGVVIPTLNCGGYLRQCVGSIRIQTLQPDVINIVDGHSDDDTRDVIAELRDGFSLIHYRIPRLGIAHARNYGIERMPDVDMVVPLDADDWLAPTYVERCAAAMVPDVGIVATGLTWADSGIVQYPKEPLTVEHMLNQNCIFSCSMFRRKCWADVGGYDEHRRTYEDWEFWLRIMKAGWEVAVIREPLHHYRPHLASSCARMKAGDHEEYVRYIREKHGSGV